MRELVLQMQVSADGFVGTLDGDVEWAFLSIDDDYNAWGVPALWDAGVHVMGATTGRDMAEHWPTSTEPYAPPMNEIPKVVFSKTVDGFDWAGTRVERGDLAEAIARMKQEPGKRILAHGGARFAQSLTRLGLVDEYHLVVHPVALGRGLALFPELDRPLRLELTETRPFRSGAVLKVYRPAPA